MSIAGAWFLSAYCTLSKHRMTCYNKGNSACEVRDLYRIREIETKDNAVIEGIIRSCLIEFGGDHEGTAWMDPDLGRFSEIYRGEDRAYWVAEDDRGAVVAGVGIGPLPGVPDTCEVQKMYCLPQARGTGMARALMDTALRFAARHYRKCYLETLESMKGAQRFYEKFGFVRIREALTETGHGACDVRYIRDLQEKGKGLNDPQRGI
jgi:putative acetyltransferase